MEAQFCIRLELSALINRVYKYVQFLQQLQQEYQNEGEGADIKFNKIMWFSSENVFAG